MKKEFAAILASLIVASSLVGCNEANESKETKDTTVATEETTTEATKSEETELTTETTVTESTEATTETTVEETDETTIEATTEATENTEVTDETDSTQAPEESDSNLEIKTYFDRLEIPNNESTDGDKEPNLFKRLRDSAIYLYEPGTSNGAVFPYYGAMSCADDIDYDDLTLQSPSYGLVDETGTIVCDPVYSQFFDIGDNYLALFLEDNQKYLSVIDNMGEFVVNIPYTKYTVFGDYIYVYDSKSQTIKSYDSEGKLILESVKLDDDVIDIFTGVGSLDNWFWCGFLLVTNAYDYDSPMINLLTGAEVEIPDVPEGSTRSFWSSASQNIRICYYDLYRNVIYNPEVGIICDASPDPSHYYADYAPKIQEVNNEFYVIVTEDNEIQNIQVLDTYGKELSSLEFDYSGGCLGNVYGTAKGLLYENKSNDENQFEFYSYSGELISSYETGNIGGGVLLGSNDEYIVFGDYNYSHSVVVDYNLNEVFSSYGRPEFSNDEIYFCFYGDDMTRMSDGKVTNIDNPVESAPYIGNGNYMVLYSSDSNDYCSSLYNSEGEVIFHYTALDCTDFAETDSVWKIY